PLSGFLPDATLQAVAAENNLAETAYLVRDSGEYKLRWSPPGPEFPLSPPPPPSPLPRRPASPRLLSPLPLRSPKMTSTTWLCSKTKRPSARSPRIWPPSSASANLATSSQQRAT